MRKTADPVMRRAVRLFEESKQTLEELGAKMGYRGVNGRKSVWQFLNHTADPRLSMLRKFAKAVGVSLSDLVSD
jgi:hypothetical protein